MTVYWLLHFTLATMFGESFMLEMESCAVSIMCNTIFCLYALPIYILIALEHQLKLGLMLIIAKCLDPGLITLLGMFTALSMSVPAP